MTHNPLSGRRCYVDVHFAHGIGFYRVTLHERFNEGVHALGKRGNAQSTFRDGSSHLVTPVFWQGLRKEPRAGSALVIHSNAFIVPRTTSGHGQHGIHAGIFAARFLLQPSHQASQGICKERTHE